jgi:hypothetical protein
VTTAEPYSRDLVIARLGPGARTQDHQGKTYHVAPAPGRTAVHFLTDRMLVVGEAEAALRAFLARPAGGAAPTEFLATLALADRRYQGAARLSTQSPNARIVGQTITQALMAESPEIAESLLKLRALADVRRIVLLSNLRSAALSGDKLQLRLQLVFADPDEAKRGAEDVRALVPVIQKPLREMLQSVAKNPRLLEPGGSGFMSPEALKWILQVYDQFALALQDVDIQPEGAVVDVRLPDITLDVAGLGTVIGEMSKLPKTAQANLHAAQLRQLGVALEDYAAGHGRLPPAAIAAPDGRPLLSWRVALLPYLGRKDLYDRFKLDEPWDSPENKKLLNQMPGVYGPAGVVRRSTTVHRALVGPGTAFADGRGITAEVKDGPANTILITAAAEGVPWTKPQELPYAPDQPVPDLGVALFADGSVRLLGPRLDEKTRRALIARASGQAVDWARVPALSENVAAMFLNQASRGIARRAGGTPDQYRWALRLAEKACGLKPRDGQLLNTLGVAQYQVGRAQEALATLTESDRLNAAASKQSEPADLAFLAMCHHRLGHREEALAGLRRLRERVKQPDQAKDAGNQAFLREAEALIEGKPAGPKE